MPKFVDHEKKKEILAEATWRIIRKEGIERATVRNIAEEAGISTGSMRHYFSTQSELFAFAMKLVSDRVRERVQNIAFTGKPFEDAQTVLLELLPLDEERSAEMEVWIAFNIKALSDPDLQALSSQFYEEMMLGITHIIDTFIKVGLAKPTIHREEEIEILYALIDGLAWHSIMQPERVSPEILKNTVFHHLKNLCQ